MAHKKGEGSVKNGRDSQSKRLGVKIYVVNLLFPVTLSFANVVRFIIPERMLVLEETSLYLLCQMVLLNSKKAGTIRRS